MNKAKAKKWFNLVLGGKGKIIALAVTISAWSWLFGFKFALLFMSAIFIHEIGHLWEMNRLDLELSGMYFIVIGAVAVPKEEWSSLGKEGKIGIMGPVFGLIPTFLAFFFWYITGWAILQQLTHLSAFVNLINLVIIAYPLDGGRIIRAIVGQYKLILGLITTYISVIMIANGLPLGVLIFMLGMPALFQTERGEVQSKKLLYRLISTYLLLLGLYILVFLIVPAPNYIF